MRKTATEQHKHQNRARAAALRERLQSELPPERQLLLLQLTALRDEANADDEVLDLGYRCCLNDRGARYRRELERFLDALSGEEQRCCEDCGQPIEEARLQAVPLATRCVPCESEVEKSRVRRIEQRIPMYLADE